MTYTYPPARQDDTEDVIHGERVADPYRWLEDTFAEETGEWIAAENRITDAFLATHPGREEIRARLTKLWSCLRLGAPFERGGRWFQWRQPALANQPILYKMATPTDEGEVLLDPNELSADGTVAVLSATPSDDGELLAYQVAGAGSDWMSIRVRSVERGNDLADHVEWVKFSQATWNADAASFYYGAPEPPLEGAEYLAQNRGQRILRHDLGSPGSRGDTVVYECEDAPDLMPHAKVSEDGRWLVITVGSGTDPNTSLHLLDLASDASATWHNIVDDFDSANVFIGSRGDTVYLLTDRGAPLKRVVAVDVGDPQHWTEVVAEESDVLLGAHHCGDVFVCHYLHHASSRLEIRALDGTRVSELAAPPCRQVLELTGRPGQPMVHFKTTGFVDSGSIFAHDLRTGETRLVSPSQVPLDPARFVTEEAFAPSADGTQVHLFLTRRADLEPDGARPSLLYGYGGFDNPVMPTFDSMWATWLERGGVLAVANLRGGGEYGRPWHEAGRLANKQNVFDDFAGCARWLAGSGWTRPDRIVINGRSNGGLLVGACLTQHPELYGAAVPEVGVLDMLRFHRFTIGWAWTADYGSADDPEQFAWLRAYSPLHNVRPGTCYPPTLVTTGDHDDRVVPGHSFKFAATLQSAQACDSPVLIRVETSAGHGLGRPTAKLIAERTDVLSFCELALGVVEPESEPTPVPG